MIKIICDICGGGEVYKRLLKVDFIDTLSITTQGREWDICPKCKKEFFEWVKNHKKEEGEQ